MLGVEFRDLNSCEFSYSRRDEETVAAIRAAGWPGLDQREAPVIGSWDSSARGSAVNTDFRQRILDRGFAQSGSNPGHPAARLRQLIDTINRGS